MPFLSVLRRTEWILHDRDGYAIPFARRASVALGTPMEYHISFEVDSLMQEEKP
jgi:hypothetical protein